MNNITYAVSVDVNNPIIPYNVYVASVLDSNVRYLEITLYQNGNVITLSNTATATASLVTDNVLVDDSVECTISNNIISVPLEDLQRQGNLDVQVTVTEGTKVLAIPFPIQVRVTPNIAEEAQIDENSMGSYAEVVQEIAEARGTYDSLKQRIDNSPSDEQVNNVVTAYLDEHGADVSGMEAVMNKVQAINSQSQTGDNDKYPSVTAVRNYVNTKTDDLQDYIENELDDLDEAKADKADYTSVKDFGAKGDGITNDTAAFNAAIAAKRFIFIPAGTYLIDDITVDKSVSIKGAGTAATYLKANSETSGGSLITIIKNRSSISDMSIHGRNGSNVNHAAITIAPHAGTEPNSIAATVTVTLENLKIQGMAGIGINILDNVEDCVISNVDIESCKSSGMKLWGVGHSISNVTSQKNKGDGIEIRQGGLHMTNVRCWGNEGNGMSMGGVSHAVISNVELQQNQLNGLYMVPVDNSGRRNRMNSIINVTTLGNNYKKVGENDEPGSALTENTCGFVVSGLYNYVQGFDVLSKFQSGWMACEKYSLLMSQPDDIGNTVDIKTAAGNGIDMYDVMFDSKYSSRIFEEPLKAKIAFNNPFNKIIVDGSAVEPPAMTASEYQSDQDVVHSNVSASVTNNGKSITLSGLTSAGVTVVDFNNFYNHSFPYRQTHKINYTSGTKRVYIRLRARVSDFRKFGIVPGVGQIINESDTQYSLDSEDLKKNCIFNTDFTTKEYYFEIPDTTVSLGSFLVELHFVKLTNDEIDEVSFEIDELSAAFIDETPTVIGDKGSNDWGLTEQELDDIAQRAVNLIPTTQGVLYGN